MSSNLSELSGNENLSLLARYKSDLTIRNQYNGGREEVVKKLNMMEEKVKYLFTGDFNQ